MSKFLSIRGKVIQHRTLTTVIKVHTGELVELAHEHLNDEQQEKLRKTKEGYYIDATGKIYKDEEGQIQMRTMEVKT